MRNSVPALIWLCILFLTVTGCRQDEHASDVTKPDTDSLLRITGPLEERLRESPDSLGLRLELAAIREEAGQIGKALTVVEAGIARDSGLAILWNRKASLELAGADTPAVIRSLQRSLRVQPDQPVILLELGFIHAAQVDSAALRIADGILNGRSDPALQTQARYLKGIYHANKGDTASAIGQFDACILQDYTFIDAYLEKGILQFEVGRYGPAMETFDKAMKVRNTDADAYYWKGRCLEALGRKTEAVEHYRKALGLDEDIKAAGDALKRLGY